MRKILICILLSLFTADFSNAQSFSAALGGGGYGTSKKVIRNGQVARSETVRKPVTRKKTVIRYEPNQIQLTEKQMEKLMPMVRRIQSNKTKSLEIVGIAKDYNIIYHRQTSLGRILKSYAPNLVPDFRQISGPAVIDSNNNTMEFIEYQ